MNLLLFISVLGMHMLNILLQFLWGNPIGLTSMGALWTTPIRSTIASALIVFLRAIVDIISISVLRRMSHFITLLVSSISSTLRMTMIILLRYNARHILRRESPLSSTHTAYVLYHVGCDRWVQGYQMGCYGPRYIRRLLALDKQYFS